MKLSEVQKNSNIKLLLIGQSGAGKTIGACTFPGKIKIFDFDGKVTSAAQFYSKDKEKLDSIDFSAYSKMPVKGDLKSGRKPRMTAFLSDVQELFDFQNSKKQLPFDTLIVDSISTLADSLLEDYREVSQTAVKRPNKDQNSMSDYGLLATHFKQIMCGILALECNVIFIGHSSLVKDESSGVITNEIMFPGQMASKLGIYFEEVYFAKINAKGEHVWQTKADSKTSFCRTQRQLPSEILANYTEIVK